MEQGACVLLMAAGQSSRFGTEKIWQPLLGRPLLEWSLEILESCPRVRSVILVVRAEHLQRANCYVGSPHKVIAAVAGGKERQESVRAGLAVPIEEPLVLVHDGARPCLSLSLVERILDALKEESAVIPALPVQETLKHCNTLGYVLETLERQGLRLAQTPQGFHKAIIYDSQSAGRAELCAQDDATLVEQTKGKVKVIEGERTNLKITEPIDLLLAEVILKERMK
ncbi:MAG: 2-C-methyl-D-erythritol 4-phosphate cytidylyltransferase [Coprothermobacterota bacterium]|nr:2-C-methyl-D-erythritol 4-phosphate cytidylyltransferase [Coprothermobacterota bacterium]